MVKQSSQENHYKLRIFQESNSASIVWLVMLSIGTIVLIWGGTEWFLVIRCVMRDRIFAIVVAILWLFTHIITGGLLAKFCMGRPLLSSNIIKRWLIAITLFGGISVFVFSLSLELYFRFVSWLAVDFPFRFFSFESVCWGIVNGIVIGLVFGVLCIIPLNRIHKFWCFDSHEAFDLSLRMCGVWISVLCTPSIIYFCFNYWNRQNCYLGESDFQPIWVYEFIGVNILVTALSVTMAIIGHLHIIRRRAWLKRISLGEDLVWMIGRPTDYDGDIAELRPLLHGSFFPKNVLWRRFIDDSFGAYRTNEKAEPVALV